MRRSLAATTITVAVLGAAALASTATAANYASGTRPHTSLRLEDHGLAIADFQAAARPRPGGHVEIYALVTARARQGTQRRVMRIARCAGSPLAVPVCHVVRSLPLTLTAGKTTIAHLHATMPTPPRSVDAVRVEIDPVGKQVLPRSAPHIADAQILLGGRAWRNRPLENFGVRVDRPWESDNQAFDVRSLNVFGTGISTDLMFATIGLTGTSSQALTIKTTELPCPSPTGLCTDPARLHSAPAAPGTPIGFIDRPALHLAHNAAGRAIHTYGLGVDAGSDHVANVLLPWTR